MTAKRVYTKEDELIGEEKWRYNTFHLLEYTDPIGLTTHFQYDLFGKKIAEIAEDRITCISYDEFGHPERISKGGCTKVQKHNCEGEIYQTWDEGEDGTIENDTCYELNSEGLKSKAVRITSQGTAEDYFEYDKEYRLIRHTDPLGNTLCFAYSQTVNSIGQTVEQKTTIDQIGNSTIETFNASGKLCLLEKKDPQENTVSLEEYFYDRAGNQARRIVHVYEKNNPIRTYTTSWEHNSRDLPIKEIEEGKKCTEYSYDSNGRLSEKKLPSGTILSHSYDALDRLLELKSSDESIHYQFSYAKGPYPIVATDKVQNITWKRAYNIFGELVKEIHPNGLVFEWEYDSQGRCMKFTLPDHSYIAYNYDALHMKTVSRYSAGGNLQYCHRYDAFDENGRLTDENLIYEAGVQTTEHDLLERVITQKNPWNHSTKTYGHSGLVEQINHSLFSSKNYVHDSLNQLIKEGDQVYGFDSLGNSLDHQVNHLNQVTNTDEESYTYDLNGNPKLSCDSSGATSYEFDGLSRLKTIHRPNQKRVHYTYDPFNRLYSKTTYQRDQSFFYDPSTWSRKSQYYLHDAEREIGTIDASGEIKELKVLGLGILGEVGAAVAIEVDNQVYIPLHDFTGNIIALASKSGVLQEKYNLDAFGKSVLSQSSISPWRFCSKRDEEHLIYFGNRFYDPKLSRFFTPDPAGALDSPNLYLYVLNAPLNRLDLFGLYSEDLETETEITYIFEDTPYIHCKVIFQDINSDWLIVGDQLQKIQFTPEERHDGKVDILHHFQDIFSSDGVGIALTTYKNGIYTTFEDFVSNSLEMAKKIPGDGLKVFQYTPTKGLIKDIKDTLDERKGVETPEVLLQRQVAVAFSESLAKISPKLYWLQISHSRAGAITNAAIDKMTGDEKKELSKRMIWLGVAPAQPLPKDYALDSNNFYSSEDHITGHFAKKIHNTQQKLPHEEWTHNVEYINCISPKKEKILYFADHAIMGRTYQSKINSSIRRLDFKYGFYKETR
jgi:RHS repeat-associated protein